MSNSPQYQVVFQFMFQQNFTGTIELDITDNNSFLIAPSQRAQLAPYLGNDTPPLLNFGMSSKQLFFSIDGGVGGRGLQSIVWSSFTSDAGDASLMVELQVSSPEVTAYYAVLGAGGGSGSLNNGMNSIVVIS
ncbi:hypothetical protein [Dyella flagellata]|uniref:Uncharacterized protein n=1 Tax=Dyella flagellata TaxID=1867833 RepID=A0ABQ5XAU4_9GAMM|nr:hypothetical protein [Dyella flagellata]GLQ87784.1 hypothetical protein GCM10007898_13520 [Dyella flagellata]